MQVFSQFSLQVLSLLLLFVLLLSPVEAFPPSEELVESPDVLFPPSDELVLVLSPIFITLSFVLSPFEDWLSLELFPPWEVEAPPSAVELPPWEEDSLELDPPSDVFVISPFSDLLSLELFPPSAWEVEFPPSELLLFVLSPISVLFSLDEFPPSPPCDVELPPSAVEFPPADWLSFVLVLSLEEFPPSEEEFPPSEVLVESPVSALLLLELFPPCDELSLVLVLLLSPVEILISPCLLSLFIVVSPILMLILGLLLLLLPLSPLQPLLQQLLQQLLQLLSSLVLFSSSIFLYE